jgi:hypothetical protein
VFLFLFFYWESIPNYWGVTIFVSSLMTACCGEDVLLVIDCERESYLLIIFFEIIKVSACNEMELGKCGH